MNKDERPINRVFKTGRGVPGRGKFRNYRGNTNYRDMHIRLPFAEAARRIPSTSQSRCNAGA